MPSVLLCDSSLATKSLTMLIPFIIVLLWVIIFLILSSYSSAQLLRAMDIHNQLHITSTAFSYFSVAFNYYVYPMLLQLALFPTFHIWNESSASSSGNSSILAISIVLAIFVIILGIFLAQHAEQSLSPAEKSLQRRIRNTTHPLPILLKTALVAISLSPTSSDIVRVVVAVLVFVFIVLEILDLYFYKPYTKQILVYSVFFGSVIAVSLVLTHLISSTEYQAFSLAAVPLFTVLLCHIWRHYIHETAIFGAEGFKQKSEVLAMHYRVGVLLGQSDQFLDSKHISFQLLGLIQSHKQQCSDIYCFCKKRQILKTAQNGRAIIDGESLRRLVLRYVYWLGEGVRSLQQAKISTEWCILFCHYAYALSDFEQPMLALSQLNRVLYQQTSTNAQNALSTINKQLLGNLSHQVKLRMTRTKKEGEADKIALFTQIVESFLESEQKSKALKAGIVQVLEMRVKLCDMIILERFESAKDMYNSCDSLAKVMNATATALHTSFYEYPSQKQRSAMAFFQAEILSDFYMADYSFHLSVDNKVSQLYAQSPIDFFSQDMVYLIVAFGKERGKIRGKSSKAASFFGYTKERFDFIHSIDDLIPAGITTIHDAFVRNFFQTGQSGLFRNLGTSIAKLESGFIQPIQLLFDINFLIQDDFTFVAFMKKLVTRNTFLIVSETGKIGGMSRNFYDQIGASNQIPDDVLLKLSQNLNVNNLIPVFWDLIKQMEEQNAVEAKHFEVVLRFIKNLDQFVSKNDDLLGKNVSEMNIRGSHKMGKSIKKDSKNSSKLTNQATMKMIRKNSFFNNDNSNNNVPINSNTNNNMSRTSISHLTPNSNIQMAGASDSDKDVQSHRSLGSRKTMRSSKSLASRKTLGWKQARLEKFQSNMIVRVRNFTTDDSRVSYKYFIVELEDLKKVANDLSSGTDSMQSMNTSSRQQSFMTMKTGRSFNTLVSGSIHFSGRSVEDSDEQKSIKEEIQLEEDNSFGKAQKTFTQGLEVIQEERNDLKQRKSLANFNPMSNDQSSNQYQTHYASIFSGGKHQLQWVARIAQQQKQKIEIESRKFATQMNSEETSRDISKKLQGRQSTPSSEQLRPSHEMDDHSHEDTDENPSKIKESNDSEESSKHTKKTLGTQSTKFQFKKAPTILVNNQDDTASFKAQTVQSIHEHKLEGSSFGNNANNNNNNSNSHNMFVLEQSETKHMFQSQKDEDNSEANKQTNRQATSGTYKQLGSQDSKGRAFLMGSESNATHQQFHDGTHLGDFTLQGEMASNMTSTIQEEKQAQKIASTADLQLNKNLIANSNYFVADDRNIDDFFEASGKKGTQQQKRTSVINSAGQSNGNVAAKGGINSIPEDNSIRNRNNSNAEIYKQLQPKTLTSETSPKNQTNKQTASKKDEKGQQSDKFDKDNSKNKQADNNNNNNNTHKQGSKPIQNPSAQANQQQRKGSNSQLNGGMLSDIKNHVSTDNLSKLVVIQKSSQNSAFSNINNTVSNNNQNNQISKDNNINPRASFNHTNSNPSSNLHSVNKINSLKDKDAQANNLKPSNPSTTATLASPLKLDKQTADKSILLQDGVIRMEDTSFNQIKESPITRSSVSQTSFNMQGRGNNVGIISATNINNINNLGMSSIHENELTSANLRREFSGLKDDKLEGDISVLKDYRDKQESMQQSQISIVSPPIPASQQRFFNNNGIENNNASYHLHGFRVNNNNNLEELKSGSVLFVKEQSSEVTSTALRSGEQFYQMIGKWFKRRERKEQINNAKRTENIRASKQYMVYEKVHSFLHNPQVPDSIERGLQLWVVGLVMFFAFCLTLLFNLRSNFAQFDTTLELMYLENEAMLPIEMINTLSLLSRQTMFKSYSPITAEGIAVQTVLLDVFDYSVGAFKTAMVKRLDDQKSSDLWQGETLEILIRSATQQYSSWNLQISEILALLMNNVDSLATELRSSNPSSTSHFDAFILPVNHCKIANYFSNLASQIHEQNKQLSSDTENLLVQISAPMIAASVAVYAAALFYLFQYRKFQENLLKFFYHSDKVSLERDAERFRVLKSAINDADDLLSAYSFQLTEREEFLVAEEDFHEKATRAMKSYKARLPEISLSQSRMLFLFVLAIFSYLAFAAASVCVVEIFLSSYSDLLANLEILSGIPSEAGNILATRELAYARFSSTLTSTYGSLQYIDYTVVVDLFKQDSLNLQEIINQVGSLKFPLIDDSLSAQVTYLLSSGICSSITYDQTYFDTTDSGACNGLLNGALTQGIATSINLLKNQLSAEYKETLFQDRTLFSDVENIQQEALALFLLSYRISQLTQEIVLNVNSKKDNVVTILTVIICVSMGVLGIFNFVIFIKGRNYLLTTYKHNKYLVLLLPQLTILMQPKFFTQFKAFLKTYDL